MREDLAASAAEGLSTIMTCFWTVRTAQQSFVNNVCGTDLSKPTPVKRMRITNDTIEARSDAQKSLPHRNDSVGSISSKEGILHDKKDV